ncbi:hypothetical protein Nepgr_018965 [Nepenthes gracilis]|uniref:Pentatricopeptide repeat-containing protein n=1 Tax=Nepenthes gracilis TaxID=150966 RepID=A0AAD3SUK7_NEPGR|nr:hypothetical protein Nepgr_018965 [Nepenthes gracilis]
MSRQILFGILPRRHSRSLSCHSTRALTSQEMELFEPNLGPRHHMYAYLLKECLRQCQKMEARRVFDEMPQRVSQVSKNGRIMHAQSLKLGFASTGQLGNAILDLYAKCGDLDFTEKVFNRLEKREVLAWNSFISMYSRIGLLDHVVKSFRWLRISGVMPNQFTYAILLSTCARSLAISIGKQVHCDVIKTGFECNSFCESSLIDFYVKCNSVNDAMHLFDQVDNPVMVSWTAMISAYARIGSLDEVIHMFQTMQKVGCLPDHVAFVTAIDAFVRLGRLKEAFNWFSRMPDPDAIAWNLMISGHAKCGYEAEAVEFFLNMRKSGVKSTRSTLGSVLSAIAGLEALDIGLLVHGQAIKQGLDRNVYVGSSLINMYAKCQKLISAREIFDSLDDRNVVFWNAMLGSYAQNGFVNEVVELFINMKESGFQADEFTYTSILSACGCLDRLGMGCQLHSIIIKNNFESNLFIGNALVDMYAKSGALTEARRLFELIQNRDNVSWNAIIVGHVQEEEEGEALEMFKRMMLDGLAPDEVALASISSACANLKDLDQGKLIHCLAVKYGLETSLYAGSSLIDMYVKCGAIAAACEIFYHMPRRSVVSMNALIAGHAQNSLEEAVNLFQIMQAEELHPSEITFTNLLDACHGPYDIVLGWQIHCRLVKNGFLYHDEVLSISLLSMYMNCLRKKDATNLFSEFPNPKGTILWTAMISGLNHNESSDEALQLYKEMRNYSVLPDQATFACILKACSTSASMRDGAEIHSSIFHTGFNSDELVVSALIDMYAKCGDVKSSLQLFEEMDSKWDVITWNSIIVGFAKNGYAEEAIRIFYEMMHSRLKPDGVTFLGVLTACSHAGKIYEGREIFDIMTNHFNIHPRMDHCACMIDLFGRWGLLNEAERFIENLEFEPDAMIWASFLGACKLHGDEIRGRRAAAKLIELEPQNSSVYTSLANLYASSGNWDLVNTLKRQMRKRGVQKLPGYSWIGG